MWLCKAIKPYYIITQSLATYPSLACHFHTWIHVPAHQRSHIHPHNEPRMYANAHFDLWMHTWAHTQTLMNTHRCALRSLPPWSQGHSVNIYWSFDGFTAIITASLPSPHLLLLLSLLLIVPSVGLSLLCHGVIKHATGSRSASNFQLWFARAGLELPVKTICSFFFYLGETTCNLKHNAGSQFVATAADFSLYWHFQTEGCNECALQI